MSKVAEKVFGEHGDWSRWILSGIVAVLVASIYFVLDSRYLKIKDAEVLQAQAHQIRSDDLASIKGRFNDAQARIEQVQEDIDEQKVFSHKIDRTLSTVEAQTAIILEQNKAILERLP